MFNCTNCWDNPCICGEAYKQLSEETLVQMIQTLQRVKRQRHTTVHGQQPGSVFAVHLQTHAIDQESKLTKLIEVYDCHAFDIDHAIEKARAGYPHSKILRVIDEGLVDLIQPGGDYLNPIYYTGNELNVALQTCSNLLDEYQQIKPFRPLDQEGLDLTHEILKNNLVKLVDAKRDY